ncbi:MAG: aspartate ammonia-lyase [Deltaproteobacteria bacterium]|nr:aspartate ammonia-lyase [Deltaproteobacteria bacterium]
MATSKVRVEEDLLGRKEVPAEAYWGIHTLRAVENFRISGRAVSEDRLFVRGLAQVKKACALANKELGSLPADKADMITRACDAILREDRCLDQFPSDQFQGGAGTSVNMNANEVIANLALELHGHEKGRYDVLHPNDHVNKCQSTNDAYPTAFRVALWEHLDVLKERIDHMRGGFERKAGEFHGVLKMGRTQLQDAVPMSLGQEFGAFATLMKEEVRIMDLVQKLILEVNLGATAIGTGVNAPEGYSEVAVRHLREITGHPYVVSPDLVEATSDCGAYVMISGAAKRLAVKLSKICNDLRLLSSGPRAGLKEINLPEMQAGSSIMPAKVNPVIPEVVNQVCFKVMGNDVTITMAAEAGQLQLNVMEPVIAQALVESITLLGNALTTLRDKCVDGITANADRCRDSVFNSIGIVTMLDPIIGHQEGDRIGKICAETGRSVAEVALERGVVTRQQLDEIFTVENMLKPRFVWKRG